MSIRPIPLVLVAAAVAALAWTFRSRTAAGPPIQSADLAALASQPTAGGVSEPPAGAETAEPSATAAQESPETAAGAVAEELLEGVVLLPDGAPAWSARVRLDEEETIADAAGRFRLPVAPDVDLTTLLAAGRQGSGTVVRRLDEIFAAPPGEPLELVLAPAPLAIEGRVIDADGQPLQGWTVALLGGTPITLRRMPPILAEDLAEEKPRFETDAEGRFRITGLIDRDYTIQAYERRTLLLVESDPTPAGTEGLVLQLSPDPLHAHVFGRVLDRRGRPVEGAQLRIVLPTSRTGTGTSSISRAGPTTGAHGLFELLDVPRDHVHLLISGEDLFTTRYELGEVSADELEISVAVRCYLQLDVPESAPDDLMIEVLDEAGTPLPISEPGSRNTRTRMSVPKGVTVLATSEDARAVRAVGGYSALAREYAYIPVVLTQEMITDVLLEGF